MESEKCRLCNGQADFVFSKQVMGEHNVAYYECETCGSLQTESPYWHEDALKKPAMALDAFTARRAVNASMMFDAFIQLLSIPSDVKAVDWHGGDGLFTRLMRDNGLDFYVYEDRCESIYASGFNVKENNIEKAPVVTCIDVLSTVFPNEIEPLFSLEPDVLLATTETYKGQGSDWAYLLPENGRRVFFYSAQGLQLIAQKHGMELFTNGEMHVFYKKQPKVLVFEEKKLFTAMTNLLNYFLPVVGRRCLESRYNNIPKYIAEDEMRILGKKTSKSQNLDSLFSNFKQKKKKSHKKPRIAIDGVFFQMAKTGIYRVWIHLFEEWAKTDFAENLIIFDRGGSMKRIDGLNYRVIEPDNKNTMDQCRLLQHYCDIEDVDVFLSTYYTYPLYTKTVMMVHDMIPEIIGFDLTEQCWVQKHEAIQNASSYVCVSNNTAKDLQALFPQVNPEAVYVAPNAISTRFKPTPSEEIQAFLKEKGLEKGYYMFVGMRGTYKNAGNFFKAFLELPDHKEKAVVCVGPMPVENTLVEMMKDDDLRADWVSEEDLLKYYAGATALVYPSLYEGFGLPLLEAMACGCPVLTSKSGVMLEVGADAAMFFNPVDVNDIADTMMKVREPEIRNKMIEKGFKRIKDFSWKDTAQIIREVLEKTALQ